jgi:hypothetical protein
MSVKPISIGAIAIALLVSSSCLASETADTSETYSPDATAFVIGPRSAGRVCAISTSADDGTEVASTWHAQGLTSGTNWIGSDAEGEAYSLALRFTVADLESGEAIRYARLRLPSMGGSILRGLDLKIRGIADPDCQPFAWRNPPTYMPRTRAAVAWELQKALTTGGPSLPLYYTTPNIASILNEVMSHPDWSTSDKVLALVIEEAQPGASANHIRIEDFSQVDARSNPPILEIYPTVAETFVAPPLLARPTDRSVTINVMNLLDIDIYAEYGTEPGIYPHSTQPLLKQAALEPIEIVLEGLEADMTYYYRLHYRGSGEESFAVGPEGHFRTQRARGSDFTFTIQADSHIIAGLRRRSARRVELYEQTLANVVLDAPDFHIDMGDFAHIEFYAGRSVKNLDEACDRYLAQRGFLAGLCRSAPFFLVLGNHEGEQGWRLRRDADSLEVWGTLARKMLFPNPRPGDFYSGSADTWPGCGLRENYFAWEWGDALFVVLDPFTHTKAMPHGGGQYVATFDGWDWTLGKDQYDWLYETLHASDAKWKLVFGHHMTGGALTGKGANNPYGRGGIDAAKFSVAKRPSFEWGGEDSSGQYVFDAMRPGWSHGPIHDILVAEGVDIFFHGHDHAFLYEGLDGVVYQTCPSPCDPAYSEGLYLKDFYSTAVKVNNSGHMRVTVSADSVAVAYVRSVLPQDEPAGKAHQLVENLDVSFSYTLRK